MTLTELSSVLGDLQSRTDRLLGVYQAAKQTEVDLSKVVADLTTETKILQLSSVALEEMLKSLSVESLESIEKLVTYGLRVVFEDQNLAFKIEVTGKRGGQWFEPKLIHGAVSAPILDSFGGGPASLAAFLLRLFVLRRMALAPVVLLDEPFSFVSAEYIENVGKLLSELASQLGMTFILVTHLTPLKRHARFVYEARETSNGTNLQPLKALESGHLQRGIDGTPAPVSAAREP